MLIAGDGDVYLIDREENVWPLRSFVAITVNWLMIDEFSLLKMTYTEDLSKDIKMYILFTGDKSYL